MKNCMIGSCEDVNNGAPCTKEHCSQWNTGEELKTETLLEKLEKTNITGYTKKDVKDLLFDLDTIVCDAMDLIDNKEYGKAWDMLLQFRVEIGEE